MRITQNVLGVTTIIVQDPRFSWWGLAIVASIAFVFVTGWSISVITADTMLWILPLIGPGLFFLKFASYPIVSIEIDKESNLLEIEKKWIIGVKQRSTLNLHEIDNFVFRKDHQRLYGCPYYPELVLKEDKRIRLSKHVWLKPQVEQMAEKLSPILGMRPIIE